METSRLQRYIQAKNNPSGALLFFLSETKKAQENKEAEKIIESLVERKIKEILPAVVPMFKGDRGLTGLQGYTPKKGVDYFTDAEKKQIIEDVLSLVEVPKPEKLQAGVDYPTISQVEKVIDAKIQQIEPEEKIELIAGVDYATPTDFLSVKNQTSALANRLETAVSTLKEMVLGIKNDLLASIEKIGVSIKNIKQQTKGSKGGGMGNWINEQFSTSSATTSISLQYPIAAGGNAVIGRYQGQVMAHGYQYTVSGNVISFTFTLDDSSTVDFTYIRG